MGIKYLKSYIQKNSDRYLIETDLRDSKLVIDGKNIYIHEMRKLLNRYGRYGVNYKKFAKNITHFLQQLQQCNIEPIIVIDGLNCVTKRDYIQKVQQRVIVKEENNALVIPTLFSNIFIDIVQEMGIKLIQAIGDADDTIAVIGKLYDCPVLSNDSDFFLYGVKFFINHRFVRVRDRRPGEPTQFALHGQMYNIEKLQQQFNDLNESILPLGLVLLSHYEGLSFLDSQMMEPFILRLNKKIKSNAEEGHKVFERTLTWLSHYDTINQAVADLLACIDPKNRKAILHTIEKHIQKFARPSVAALQCLGLERDTISQLIAEHHSKFEKFEGDLNVLTIPTILKIHEDDHEVNSEGVKELSEDSFEKPEKYEQFSEKQLYEKIPYWLIKDYAVGNISGECIEMRMYRVFFMKPNCEPGDYAKLSEFFFPILTAMFSLMTSSCRSDKSILKVYAYRGAKVIRKKLSVQKSAIQLENIGDLGLHERRAILNQALGFQHDETFDGFPVSWKLYIGTVIFWMRSKSLLVKNETHLRAVLGAIMCSVVQEKMAVSIRRQPDIPLLSEVRNSCRVTAQKSLQEALDAITYQDCNAVWKFFHRQMDTNIDTRKDPERMALIMNTFRQLDICVYHAMQFNALLGFPYAKVSVEKLIDGALFYNLYETFRGQEAFHYYLTDCFKQAPNVLNGFLSLERIVMKAMER